MRQPPSILAHLRRWRRLTNGESGFVVEYRGQPVARVKVGFASAVALAGLGKGVSPHTQRHSAVTHLMQQGVPTWEVAGFAGMGEAVLRQHDAHHPDHCSKPCRR